MGCRRNPSCCCVPILERDDPFDSKWTCWKGDPAGLSGYEPLNPDWTFDTAAGKLIRNDTLGTTIAAQDGIWAVAKVLTPPYTMETTVYVDSFYQNPYNLTSGPMKLVHGCIVTSDVLFYPQTTVDYGYNCYGQSTINSSSVTWFKGPAKGGVAFKLMYRTQVDVDGVTRWVYIDDVAPTVIPEPGFFTPSWPFGTKKPFDFSSTPNESRSLWGMNTTMRASPPAEIFRSDRLHIAKWNHVTDPRPLP